MFFGRRKPSGMVGIGVRADGVALARVIREGGQRPRLTHCEFRATPDKGNWQGLLTDLVRETRLAGQQCTFVLEPGDYHLMLMETPRVETTELRQAVRWRIKDLIDFPIDEAVVDIFELPQVRGRGLGMIYAVAARHPRVQGLVEAARSAGLALHGIDIAELALRNVTTLTAQDDTGSACLELDHRQGLLILTRQGQLYLARTLDLSLLHHRSESLVSNLDGLALELQRSFDYCESHFDLPTPNHLLLGPMDSPPPELHSHLETNLGVSVRTLDLEALLETDRTLPAGLKARCLLAVGAALRQEAVSR